MESGIRQFLEAVKISKGDIYYYKGAICIVDGVNFLDQVEDIETVERQLKFCHLVIISKVDLIEHKDKYDESIYPLITFIGSIFLFCFIPFIFLVLICCFLVWGCCHSNSKTFLQFLKD